MLANNVLVDLLASPFFQENVTKKVRILDVVYNATSNELVTST